MPDYQLDLIRRYCDTTGIRLSRYEKDLLCKILENPESYDGYTSDIYEENGSGKDYRGSWDSTTKWQYRINVFPTLSIAERHRHACDGYIQDEHWEWRNAWHITNTRKLIKILKQIEHEL